MFGSAIISPSLFFNLNTEMQEGIINEVGGMKEALSKLHEMITKYKQTTDKK